MREMRRALEGSGLEDRIYIVGGMVRDTLLEREVSDPDFMTDCDPADLCRLLVSKGFGHKPEYLPEFYSAKLYRGDVCVEMTGGRSETYTHGSRKPKVEPAPLEEDAFRRDFTVNALYQNLFSGEILDPTGKGLADLKARALRTPIDPAVSFRRDPLRILRGARFASQLGFDLTTETALAAAEAAGETALLSPERKREELTRLLLTPDPRKGLRLLMDLGIMEYILPSLPPLKGYMAKPGIDVWEHTLRVVAGVPASLELRYAALLHDVSKPRVATSGPDGSLTFPGHAAASAEMAEEALERLRMPKAASRDICRLIEGHNCFFKCSEDREFRRLIHKNRDRLEDLLSLMQADKRSVDGGPQRYADMLDRYRALYSPALLKKELSPLSGSDLKRMFDLKGRKAGEAKELLRERVLEGRPDSGDRQAAKKLIKHLLEEGTL